MGGEAVQKYREEMRNRQLERFGNARDSDLFDGRFAGKKSIPGTSSTRPSTALGKKDQEDLSGEEAIKDFLSRELNIFFLQCADASLFVKVLVCDGIVT